MGNAFGQLFRISTWGESHGGGVGVVLDGCPPCVPITAEEIQVELDRRRPGQSKIVTPRQEADQVEILSGVFEGKTLGTPIMMWVRNKDARPEAYAEMSVKFRPSHADFTYETKYGIRDPHGGGRSSARETVGRVAAGAIARKILQESYGVEIVAYVKQIQEIIAEISIDIVQREAVEANIVRCPDAAAAESMIERVESIRSAGDSVGGIVECVVRGAPVGWGSPVFDRLEADLAKAMLSLPACKGFDVGSGFESVSLTGLQHNDAFRSDEEGQVRTTTNRSGGVQGGISNGMPIYFRTVFKPTATVMHEQETVNQDFENTSLKGRGRHDPCVLPRAVPIVEAMTALVLMDHAMRDSAQCGG